MAIAARCTILAKRQTQSPRASTHSQGNLTRSANCLTTCHRPITGWPARFTSRRAGNTPAGNRATRRIATRISSSLTERTSAASAFPRGSVPLSATRGSPDTVPPARYASAVKPPLSRRVREVHGAALASRLRPRTARRRSPRASSTARTTRVPHVPRNRCSALAPRPIAAASAAPTARFT